MAESPDPLESTVELLAGVRRGDQVALDRLMARHVGPLRRWASGRLPAWARDMSDTDDLVQDTLVRTLRRLEDFDVRGPGALHAYLRQAVTNRLRDELRRIGKAPVFVSGAGEGLDGGDSPLEIAIGREAFERYRAALGRLRPEDREAVIGRVEMDCSYAELAAILDKPTADAARKAAERALLRLAEEMKP